MDIDSTDESRIIQLCRKEFQNGRIPVVPADKLIERKIFFNYLRLANQHSPNEASEIAQFVAPKLFNRDRMPEALKVAEWIDGKKRGDFFFSSAQELGNGIGVVPN